MRGKWLAVCLVLTATAAAGAETTWHSYVNDRFGATADVPAGWQEDDPPANDDGRGFTSPDGKATVSVYGGLAGVESIDEDFRLLLSPNDGDTITYKHRGKDSVTVSGTNGGRIFYRKAILACGRQVWDGISVEYPAGEKAKYDALVNHVAKSLRAGTGYQITKCR